VELQANDPLNLNITHRLLSLSRNEVLVSDIFGQRSAKASPYVVRNRSGEKLTIILRRDLVLALTAVVVEGEDLPIDFREVLHASLLKGSSSSSNNVAPGGTSTSTSSSSDSISPLVFSHFLLVRLAYGEWGFER